MCSHVGAKTCISPAHASLWHVHLPCACAPRFERIRMRTRSHIHTHTQITTLTHDHTRNQGHLKTQRATPGSASQRCLHAAHLHVLQHGRKLKVLLARRACCILLGLCALSPCLRPLLQRLPGRNGGQGLPMCKRVHLVAAVAHLSLPVSMHEDLHQACVRSTLACRPGSHAQLPLSPWQAPAVCTSPHCPCSCPADPSHVPLLTSSAARLRAAAPFISCQCWRWKAWISASRACASASSLARRLHACTQFLCSACTQQLDTTDR